MVKGFTGDNLNSHTKSIVPIISKMISVAGESRKSAMNTSSFDRPISIRGLKRWLQKTIQFSAMDNSIEHAFKQSILNAYPPSQRPALNEFYKDVAISSTYCFFSKDYKIAYFKPDSNNFVRPIQG